MNNDIRHRLRDELLEIERFPFDKDHISLTKSKNEKEAEVLIFDFKSRTDTEFDIYAEFYSTTYNLNCDGWHEHFEYHDTNLEDTIKKIKEQLITLTNGKTKLRTKFSGRSPIKWELIYNYEDDKHESLGIVGLILYNYFGKRTEIIKTNKLLV